MPPFSMFVFERIADPNHPKGHNLLAQEPQHICVSLKIVESRQNGGKSKMVGSDQNRWSSTKASSGEHKGTEDISIITSFGFLGQSHKGGVECRKNGCLNREEFAYVQAKRRSMPTG